MGKPVVHWEFWSEDPASVAAFYEQVFDWKVQHFPEIDYYFAETNEGSNQGINGGIFQPKRGGPWPAKLSFYIDVDDLAAYREKIVAAGGQILVEEQEVPNMGKFSLFSDPEGRVLGIWKQT